MLKIPFIITIGDKEEKSNTLAIRRRDGKVEYGVKVEKLVHELKGLIEKRM